jgi:hypothetical protein
MARITKANGKGERVLTLRELNRALLERQLLLARQRLTVPRAIERLCALQAQYAPSPYIALWSRLTGFRKEQLTRALEDRKAVKSSLFRITLHITSARDYPYYAAAWLPAAREMTPRVSVERMAELSHKVHAAAQKQITHEQLEAIAAEEMGGRWRTRTLAPLLHVPPAGTWGFHGRPELLVLDAWLGVDLPPREEGARHLVRSYLSAFGPATQQDLLRFAVCAWATSVPGSRASSCGGFETSGDASCSTYPVRRCRTATRRHRSASCRSGIRPCWRTHHPSARASSRRSSGAP